ncbi:MAG TPA: DnaA/Hda family protein, partial [Caulobacteraceae bacterium]|nr:DnaA/Hda family protein [Caulobacteraceae bacterium]
MTNRGYATMAAQSPVGALWGKACQALRRELGDDTFGSWLSQASLREGPGGSLVLVTPTGIARDWIRRNAWRRIGELWAQNDPQGRRLDLKSRIEFEAGEPIAEVIEIAQAVSTDLPAVAPVTQAPTRTTGLQERFTFDTFVPGPANEFAHAVARRVASWADGHFNPVVFHGPYGFGKT